ncbi:MAG: hypothetical protein LBH51_07085 [Treponema sp.]|jgi:hypothetical protein|nr:hypothetical protein [Treponema sp.]
MAESINLEALSSRAGFNAAVRHIKKTLRIAEDVGDGANLGDLLHDPAEGELSGERAALILRMLLVDKLGYQTLSVNLASVAEDLPALAREFSRWNGVDLVVSYQHPDLGLLTANPKLEEELAGLGLPRKRELLVVYAGKGSAPADDWCRKAAELAADLFQGRRVKVPAALLNGRFTVKKTPGPQAGPERESESPEPVKGAGKKAPPAGKRKAAPAEEGAAEALRAVEASRAAPALAPAVPAVSRGAMKMTPMYSVAVTNELFHNGNVEAWKRIIDSYKARYPDLHVYIYYEGERILDINSLFKWGKVKHGRSIQFAIAGAEIKDAAKLQRYLVQGASSQFEAFLRGPVSGVLRLFG